MTEWIAPLALLVSTLSLCVSFSGYLLNRRQDARKRPHLIAGLIDCEMLRSERFRSYSFRLSVSNPSDADNGLSVVKFVLKYRTSRNAALAIQVSPALADETNVGQTTVVGDSIKIGARQTLTGVWVFRVANEIFDGATVESYEVALTDSARNTISIFPVFIRERCNEAV